MKSTAKRALKNQPIQAHLSSVFAVQRCLQVYSLPSGSPFPLITGNILDSTEDMVRHYGSAWCRYACV